MEKKKKALSPDARLSQRRGRRMEMGIILGIYSVKGTMLSMIILEHMYYIPFSLYYLVILKHRKIKQLS